VRSALQECAANASPCYHAHTFTHVRTHARTHAHTPANTHAHMRVCVFAQFYAREEGTHAPARCRHTRSQAIRRCSRLRAARQTTHEHQSIVTTPHASTHARTGARKVPATDTRGRTRTHARARADARMHAQAGLAWRQIGTAAIFHELGVSGQGKGFSGQVRAFVGQGSPSSRCTAGYPPATHSAPVHVVWPRAF
jgi:hypothetical protein